MYMLFICLWPLLELIYSKCMPVLPLIKEKIARNMVSFSNATGTIILGSAYYYTGNEYMFKLTVLYPISYYIYDTYLIITKNLHSEFPYIYHHLITVYLLETLLFANLSQRNILLHILIPAELSNLPIYYVYHIIKTGFDKNQAFFTYLIKWKKIQILWYILFRVFYFSYFVYHNYHNIDGFVLRNLALSIYLLGIYWVIGQIKSLQSDLVKRESLKVHDC